MPERTFPFEQSAGPDGSISIEETFEIPDLPFSIKLKELSFRTTTGCENRTHAIQAKIAWIGGGDPETILEIFGSEFVDCQPFSQRTNVRVKEGEHTAALSMTNFNPSENIEGTVTLEYSLGIGLDSDEIRSLARTS